MNNEIIISIIMPTCDRGEVFEVSKEAVLNAIAAFKVEYIVVNDSKKSTLELTENERSHMQVYDNPTKGVASARNFGASKAKGDILMFLDDDVIIRSENIKAIFEIIEKIDMHKSCFNLDWVYPPELVTKISKTQFGRFLLTHDFTTMKGWSNDPNWKENDFFEVKGLASFCLIISKQKFEEINGYNEIFPLAGFEDDEFSRRASKILSIYVCTNSVVWHNESDRVQPKAWLVRKERGAHAGYTKQIAEELGRTDLILEYSIFKKAAYTSIHFFRTLILNGLKLVPNKKSCDLIYFKGIKLLLGASIYKGYKRKS